MGLEKEIASVQSQKELDSMRLQAKRKRIATLESTREMVNLFHQCEDAGISTWVNLKRQDATLGRVESKMDQMHSNLVTADKTLVKIEKGERACCWCSFCPSCKSKPKEDNPNLWRPVVAAKNRSWDDNKEGHFRLKSTPTPMISEKDPQLPKDSIGTETEIDQNLDQVSIMVKNLKTIALEVGQEVTVGNEQLDRLNLKTASNVRTIHSMTKRVKVLV
ncbi:unnamed protein product [Allacma fusca]|uniref:t-SNARE coiled-coil homology domain-containing protein n=1 Tax=Allacma fusca TaxID=39272 RepID=A0A8J2LTU9_9HEXA|nr:unnamed protein product [Allacma fusca]